MFLTSPDLQRLPGITHGFFGRKGGVSKGIYDSLNCGWGSHDAPENIAQNRKLLMAAMGAPEAPLQSLYQIHSADVLSVTAHSNHSDLPRADAMVTGDTNIALGVLAADCVPVLFADAEARVIGAAHAGWKGALGGILENTVTAMQALGATPKHITAAIGPCIGKASYEVGAEYRERFIQHTAAYETYFSPSANGGHFYFDIKRFAHDRLAACGLSTINILENDTYLEEDAFFSYRRATHRGEPDYGRQISLILLHAK